MSQDSITVVETVYFRPDGEEAEAAECKFSRLVNCKGEQLYDRKMKATPNWAKIDFGWVPEPCMIFIKNTEGKFKVKTPTKEDLVEVSKKILEIAYTPGGGPLLEKIPANCWTIPPGESFRGCPSNPGSLYIRSRHGIVKFTLYAYPGA